MAAKVTSEQIVRGWGNGLGFRITSALAKAGHIGAGTRVVVEAVEGGLFVRPVAPPKMSLEDKLKAFNPELHGGEVMADGRVGVEVF